MHTNTRTLSQMYAEDLSHFFSDDEIGVGLATATNTQEYV